MKHESDKDAIIRLFRVYKRFGGKNALVDLSLDVFRNELLYVSGPTMKPARWADILAPAGAAGAAEAAATPGSR